MKTNTIEYQGEDYDLPQGLIDKIVESQFVETKKSLTMNDVRIGLPDKGWYIDTDSMINRLDQKRISSRDNNVVNTVKRAEQLQAITNLLNVCDFLNQEDDWVPDDNIEGFSIEHDYRSVAVCRSINLAFAICYFKTRELAEQAVELLGKETIRKAHGR